MEPIPLQGLLKKWDESMAGCDVIKVGFHAASARLFGEARGMPKSGMSAKPAKIDKNGKSVRST
ncbi:hypothetical protein [Paraburkholderia sp. MM5477-R1]|uniref:hypothetical protein n=1 Tax=Paraburkholderia sp. MM5477-R1 TaxID=2991062 RepID=UPI003D196FEC